MAWIVSDGKVSDVESQWWESQWCGELVVGKSVTWKVNCGSQWCRVCGGKVSDVESQWWESQWRGESVVGKSVMWKVNGGRVSGVEN